MLHKKYILSRTNAANEYFPDESIIIHLLTMTGIWMTCQNQFDRVKLNKKGLHEQIKADLIPLKSWTTY